ncbi:MAG: hypothetical protein JXR94_22225 [Candidatus Hydrogenedentes bacterium]|nr:hypothetical protein [Candidatus Hydrogenedentota bacterium]
MVVGSNLVRYCVPLFASTMMCSAGAGPVEGPADLPKVKPADLSLFSPDDLSDAELIVPFYLAHCHRVANSIQEDGPNRGFITLPVWRPKQYNEPYNARVLENFMPLTYFYCTNRPWNPYYGDGALRLRLEALLDFWCRAQHTDGRFSEYEPEGWNLPATGFAVMFMGETLRLLDSGPPIDEGLHERVIAAQGKACRALLTSAGLFDHARKYSNQYSGLWGGVLAFLEVCPDAELESLIRQRLEESLECHQSPAGYWYEAGGCDWAYTSRTHAGNLLMAWHYAHDTDLAPLFALGETRWAEWVAYNTVLEPDGRTRVVNRAIETRTRGDYGARHNPLSEVAPLGRAFVDTQSEVDESIRRQRAALAADWPKVAELEVGGHHAYSPHPILNLGHGRWHPSDAERAEARRALPYVAGSEFNHQRVDTGCVQIYTYVRRPAYYAAFNAGKRLSAQQRFGLGLLWTDAYGAVLQSQSGTKRAAWGTRAPEADWVYEGELTGASWRVGDMGVAPEPGVRDLPQGDLVVTYSLDGAGEKAVTFGGDRIAVRVTHPGAFVEQFPLLVPEGTEPHAADGVANVAGDGIRIVFPPASPATWHREDVHVAGKELVTLTLAAADTLTYELCMIP